MINIQKIIQHNKSNRRTVADVAAVTADNFTNKYTVGYSRVTLINKLVSNDIYNKLYRQYMYYKKDELLPTLITKATGTIQLKDLEITTKELAEYASITLPKFN